MKYRPTQPNINKEEKQSVNKINIFKYKDGTDYKGPYIYIKDIPYLLNQDNTIGERLYTQNSNDDIYTYIELKNSYLLNYTKPIPYNPLPSKKDYEQTYIDRYFVKRRNSNDSIIEISKNQYNTLSQKEIGIDENLYIGTSLQWKIYGILYDKYENDLIIEYGVYDTNKRTVQLKEKELPTLNKYLNQYAQFAKINSK